MPSLDKLKRLRLVLVGAKRIWLTRIWKMDIHESVQMSLSAKFDLSNPGGVHVGQKTYIAFDVRILAHDMTRGRSVDTRIGANCFIGGRSLILPGVTIGNNCIVGAGSVVTRDIPDFSIAAGNPARVIREDRRIGAYGVLPRDGSGTG